MTLLMSLFLLMVQKAPDEIEVQGRWKSEGMELRVGTAPWIKTHEQLLEQLSAAKAGPETSIVLALDPDIPADPVTALLDFLKSRKFLKVEFAVVVVKKKPGKPGAAEEPKQPPTPLLIEIVHKVDSCVGYAKEPVCPEATHWSIGVGPKSCAGRGDLLETLRGEGVKARDRQVRGVSARPLTIWADGKAPYGLVAEVGVVSREAGFWGTTFDGKPDAKPKPPDPGTEPVAAKDAKESYFSVRIGIRRKDGIQELRVDQGDWVRTEKDWMIQLRSKKARPDTDLRLDADSDVAWSAVLRIKDILEDWGFNTFVYLTPCFLLDGPVLPTLPPEAEAAEWARALDRTVNEGDPKAVDRALYREELDRRICRTVRLTAPMRLNVARIAETMFPLSGAHAGTPASLHFLGINAGRPLFRVLSAQRVDYVSFVLGKTSDGKIRIVDLYSVSGGDLASDTVHASYLTDAKSLEILNALKAPIPDDLAMCMGKPGEMMRFVFEGKPKEALDFYDKNAEEFSKNKVAHRLRMGISGMVGVDEFCKALEEFERDLPEDSSHLYLRVERHLLTRNRKKALASIDALDRFLQDAFLDVRRADVHQSADDFPAARKSLERAVEREPKLERAWWSLISVCIAQKDYRGTAATLTAAEKAGIPLGNLEEIPSVEPFVQSPEYREWLKSRK